MNPWAWIIPSAIAACLIAAAAVLGIKTMNSFMGLFSKKRTRTVSKPRSRARAKK